MESACSRPLDPQGHAGRLVDPGLPLWTIDRDPIAVVMLPGMTTTENLPADLSRERRALETYYDDPLEPGDAVLLIDSDVCLEIAGLADDWCATTRDNLIDVLRRSARRVVVAVARPAYELTPSDYQLWRDLHAGLRDGDVDLQPLRALPAS